MAIKVEVSGNRLPPVRTIAIVAPASRPEPLVIDAARVRLESEGFVVRVDERCFLDAGWTAGDDAARLASLSDALLDDSVDAILCARGGFGSPRIAEDIPAPGRPKVVIGYSDISYLLARVQMLPGGIAVHGPLASDACNPDKAFGFDRLLALMKGEDLSDELASLVQQRLDPIHPGPIEGPMGGGNLASVQLLAGAASQRALVGCVLMLEEVGERMYEIDRSLDHLRRAGILAASSGVLLGDMTPRAEDAGFDAGTLRRTLATLGRRIGKPVYAGAPCGHGPLNFPVVFGSRIRIG